MRSFTTLSCIAAALLLALSAHAGAEQNKCSEPAVLQELASGLTDAIDAVEGETAGLTGALDAGALPARTQGGTSEEPGEAWGNPGGALREAGGDRFEDDYWQDIMDPDPPHCPG